MRWCVALPLVALSLGCVPEASAPAAPDTAKPADDVGAAPRQDSRSAQGDIRQVDIGQVDVGQGDVASALPPGGDAECDCQTAEAITHLPERSHASCNPPGPDQVRARCEEAKTQVFKTGSVYGVDGCKFEVTCP